MKNIVKAAAVAAVTAAALAVPAAAFASSDPVVVINDNHGVLTSESPLYTGESLTAFGYATGTFTVTSLTPDGLKGVRVTLSAPLVLDVRQSSESVDFHAAN